MKTLRRKRNNNRNKTNKRNNRNKRKIIGGLFDHKKQTCSQTPNPEYTNLTNHIKSPYHWTMIPYESAGCDMYIWNKNAKDHNPHIHIHGFTNNQYQYTISAKNIRNKSAQLINNSAQGYKNALQEMLDVLNDTQSKREIYSTPLRQTEENDEPNTPYKTPQKFPFPIADVFSGIKAKLGPRMGQYADKSAKRSLLEDL